MVELTGGPRSHYNHQGPRRRENVLGNAKVIKCENLAYSDQSWVFTRAFQMYTLFANIYKICIDFESAVPDDFLKDLENLFGLLIVVCVV